MNSREENRIKKINQIFNNLKRTKGKLNYLDVILSQQVSERKAKEYLKVAKYMFEKWKE